MAKTVPVRELRAGLAEFLDEVADLREHVIVTRNGRRAAVLVPIVWFLAKTAAIINEKMKVWKGEPFEKAMVNYYLGLVYYMRHDYENARAAYQSAEGGVRQAAAFVQQAENDLSHTSIDSPMDGKVVQLNAHEGEVVVTFDACCACHSDGDAQKPS